MDLEEDDTPRHLLRGFLDIEPNRSPVTRSTSAEAQHSRSSTRQSARLRSNAGGGPQSSSSSARRSARNNAGALNPQEALKRKLRESTLARISLPVGNRRTTSHVTRKSTRVSALQDDDVTPRHILKNILQKEPEVSLLFQEKAVGKKPVLPESTSSMGSSHPSPRLSDLEFSSMALAAADQSVGLKRKRPHRILDVTAFEKRLKQESAVSLEKAARKEPAMGSISPSSGLSELELSNVTMATTDHSVRRLRRNRSPRILNVTDFEKRLNQDIDRPARGSSPFPSASTTLSGVTLSLKTPHMDAPTEKKALQRKAPRHQFSVEAFEEGVYNRLRVDGTTGGVSSKAACSDDFTLNLSAGPEYTTDLFDHATTLYAQPTVMGSTIPITATQDKATVLASQIQRDTGDEGEMSQDEQMEGECSKLIRNQPASYPADDGEEEEDAATPSQSDKAESQTEEEAVEEQPEDDKPVESQPEEDAAMSQPEEDEAESQPEEDEAESQPEEDEAESQPEEDEAESQPEEDEAESQPEEDAAMSQQDAAMYQDEAESQPEEDEAESQPEEDEAESQPEEDAAMSQQDAAMYQDEAESQPEEDEAESQPEEDEAESHPEEDEAESHPEDEAESQPEEDEAESKPEDDEVAHESQTHEVDPDSQLEEETPEEEPGSPTDDDDDENPESQPEEEEAESQPEDDAAVSQTDEVSQTDDEAHESQTHEVDPDSQLEEETPEEEPGSQTDDGEVPGYQMEEEAVPDSQSEEEDNGKPESALEGTPTRLSHVTEKVSHRAFRSEGGGLVPVAVDGGRDYRSMGAVPKKATEAEWTGHKSAGEGPSERHSGHIGGTSAHIAEADQEDPADHEEWEDEENEMTEDLSMKTPAFIRAIRKGVVTKPQSSPAALRNIQPSVSVQPKKRTAKTGGQKKKEPPTIFTKSYCMGNFRHFAKTKVSPDVYPVLKDTMEKFFDRMVEDLETYADHAKRKTIEVEDVVLLLKRQGHVTDKVPVEVLIEKYLDMAARKQLIPCASSGNVVFPKSLP